MLMKTLLPMAVALSIALSGYALANNVIRTDAPIAKASYAANDGPSSPPTTTKPEPEKPVAKTSCKDILNSGGSTGSGIYTITLSSSQERVYCDMATAGGGWTMVVAQFENDPVTNWDEGIQPDYDPSLAIRRGFALNSAQIPAHTQTGFGKDLNPVALDYGDMVYQTGDFGPVTVQGKRTGTVFQAHRSRAFYYDFHDVGGTTNTSDMSWANSLTFDATSYRYAWAFSPMRNTNPVQRGYAFNGVAYDSADAFAWTVWVR